MNKQPNFQEQPPDNESYVRSVLDDILASSPTAQRDAEMAGEILAGKIEEMATQRQILELIEDELPAASLLKEVISGKDGEPTHDCIDVYAALNVEVDSRHPTSEDEQLKDSLSQLALEVGSVAGLIEMIKFGKPKNLAMQELLADDTILPESKELYLKAIDRLADGQPLDMTDPHALIDTEQQKDATDAERRNMRIVTIEIRSRLDPHKDLINDYDAVIGMLGLAIGLDDLTVSRSFIEAALSKANASSSLQKIIEAHVYELRESLGIDA